jgi:hypothetical protein
VASIPNLAKLGTRFVLQGGTQNNLAVVKAEVDFIHNSFRAAGKKPEIIVHEHCGESGAIGAAVESMRLWRNGHAAPRSSASMRFAKSNTAPRATKHALQLLQEQLPAHLHRHQARDQGEPEPASPLPVEKVTKVPLMHGEQRLIIATCEKGLVEDVNDMKDIKAGLDEIKISIPTSSTSPPMKCSVRTMRRMSPIRSGPRNSGTRRPKSAFR